MQKETNQKENPKEKGDQEQKHPGGRPTKMTEVIVQKLEQAFSFGATDLEACRYAGICKATLYNWQSENPEFLDRKELLKSTPILKAREAVIKGFENDPALALKFLERKVKDEFSLRREHSGPDGKPIDIKTNDDDRIQKIADLLDSAIGDEEDDDDGASDSQGKGDAPRVSK